MVRLLIMILIIGRMTLALTINPPIIHEEFKDGVIAKEIVIVNDTNEKKRYKLDIKDDENYLDWSLKDDIKIFPWMLSLNPKEKRSVRIRVVKNALTEGEYKGYLVVSERPINIGYDKVEGTEGVKVDLEIITNYWLSIYGTEGNVDRSVEVDSRLVDNRLYVKAKSTGNAGNFVWASAEIEDEYENKRVEEIPICRVMRGALHEVVKEIKVSRNEKIGGIKFFTPDKKSDGGRREI